MRKYELMFIIKPDLDEEATEATATKVNDIIARNGGEITNVDKWGKRRLAYEVQDYKDGFYVLVDFDSEPNVIAEIERLIRISEDVIKYLITRKEG